MSNMSYCRFENTLNDLRDCEEHLSDDESEMSEYEKDAKKNLIKLCIRISKQYEDYDFGSDN